MSEHDDSLQNKVSQNSQDETSILASIAEWLRKGLTKVEEPTWQETVEEFIEAKEDVAERISDEERSLLLNLLRFGQLTVDQAMVPRSDIIALNQNSSLEDTMALIKQKGHSRMPVYRSNLDDVAGMIHIRDVLAYWGEDSIFKLPDIMREILFVPASMPIVNLLVKMRQTRLHMAIVVDEYGGTDGLVTIEDIVEEIVGELEDEHDEDSPPIVERGTNIFDIEARAELIIVEETIGITFDISEEIEDIDTIGGLVISLAGKVPEKGELILYSENVDILVLDADPRKVKKVRITIKNTDIDT
tara:strand:+ start:9000 stop:9905 length:906 start_codon:yes stop_codon:yes gene_type:complete